MRLVRGHTEGKASRPGTGFQIGRDSLVGRIYDKREELALRAEEKRSVEEARWSAAGWDGLQDVTRVEFQLRADALDEIDGGRLRDPEMFLARLSATWGYCTRTWLKLVMRGRATRLHRCPVDVRWRVVQRAGFGESDGEIALRERRRGCGRARLALSHTLSYLEGTQEIPPLPIGRAREHVAAWSEGRCDAYVRTQIASFFARAHGPVAEDLIGTLGPRDAAAFVIEKRNAVCVRAEAFRLGSKEQVREFAKLGGPSDPTPSASSQGLGWDPRSAADPTPSLHRTGKGSPFRSVAAED